MGLSCKNKRNHQHSMGHSCKNKTSTNIVWVFPVKTKQITNIVWAILVKNKTNHQHSMCHSCKTKQNINIIWVTPVIQWLLFCVLDAFSFNRSLTITLSYEVLFVFYLFEIWNTVKPWLFEPCGKHTIVVRTIKEFD